MSIQDRAFELLKENQRITNGHTYTVPSPSIYPYQWLWDSCFHAIILAKRDPQTAMKEIRSLLSRQFRNGMIPHIIYWVPGTLHRYNWGTDGTSSITQPPMLAYAVREIYNATDDNDFLTDIYPNLYRYYRYLIDKRDPRNHHLAGIIDPDESGEDNSPRFDKVLNVPSDISLSDHLKHRIELVDDNRKCNFNAEVCMKKYFWVKDIPFNSILIENINILVHIASILDKETDVQYLKAQIELIRTAMRERLFEGGIFWSAFGSDYTKLHVATWAHFAPLFAKLYSNKEAKNIIEHELLNENTFSAQFGIRTVSKKESSYRPDGYWRGSVWMATHWFIYKGLMRYGFVKEAQNIHDKSMALLEKSGFREYFNPETGEGYGAHNFTWGTLVLDMIDE